MDNWPTRRCNWWFLIIRPSLIRRASYTSNCSCHSQWHKALWRTATCSGRHATTLPDFDGFTAFILFLGKIKTFLLVGEQWRHPHGGEGKKVCSETILKLTILTQETRPIIHHHACFINRASSCCCCGSVGVVHSGFWLSALINPRPKRVAQPNKISTAQTGLFPSDNLISLGSEWEKKLEYWTLKKYRKKKLRQMLRRLAGGVATVRWSSCIGGGVPEAAPHSFSRIALMLSTRECVLQHYKYPSTHGKQDILDEIITCMRQVQQVLVSGWNLPDGTYSCLEVNYLISVSTNNIALRSRDRNCSLTLINAVKSTSNLF